MTNGSVRNPQVTNVKRRAQMAIERYDALKREFAAVRSEIQAARDALTMDMISDAMRENADAGREPISGLAAELMDLSQKLIIICDPLERIWWDKRKHVSTVEGL